MLGMELSSDRQIRENLKYDNKHHIYLFNMDNTDDVQSMIKQVNSMGFNCGSLGNGKNIREKICKVLEYYDNNPDVLHGVNKMLFNVNIIRFLEITINNNDSISLVIDLDDVS